MIPVLLCVLFAHSITSAFSLSIFDVLTSMKNLPYLPVLKSIKNYEMKAEDIMTKNFLFLTLDSSLGDIV